MAGLPPQPTRLSDTASSRKHQSPHDDPEAKRRKEQPAQRSYDNIIAKDQSRTHVGDSHQRHEYHAPVHQYSDRLSAESQPESTSKRMGAVLDSLKFNQMEDNYLTIKSAYADTCQWLFKRVEYVDWLDSAKKSANNGLWIKGKPGAGKSTLMKCAVQHAQDGSDNATVISFFFRARGSAL